METARAAPSGRDVSSGILWSLGTALLLHQIWHAIHEPFFGIDITNFRAAELAFLAHRSPYTLQAPPNNFVFPPSSLVLLAPLALFPPGVVRYGYLVVQTLAILASGLLALRIFNVDWKSPAGGATVLGTAVMVMTGPNLLYSNVNGLLLLGEAIFLLAAARNRWLLAGAALGATLALKPALIGLLLVPIVWRRWSSLIVAIGIPVLLSAAVVPFLAGYHVFLTNVLPYLVHGQAESFRWANVTLVGAGGAIGLGRALTDGARVLVALAAGAAILWRLRQEVDERLKIVEVAGLVVLVTLLDASFGWYAYGIWLIPLLVSAVHPSALVRTWTAWLGVYLFASPTSSTTPFVGADPGVKQLDFTAGYLVLLLVLGAVAFRSGALFRSHRGVPRDAILVWPWRR